MASSRHPIIDLTERGSEQQPATPTPLPMPAAAAAAGDIGQDRVGMLPTLDVEHIRNDAFAPGAPVAPSPRRKRAHRATTSAAASAVAEPATEIDLDMSHWVDASARKTQRLQFTVVLALLGGALGMALSPPLFDLALKFGLI